MKRVQKDAEYLGAPLFNSSSKIKDFKFLQEKLEARLKGLRRKCLLWAGRHTMIKAVAHALPTYTFSTCDAPNTVCARMDVITRRFWWNPSKDSGRLSWQNLWKLKLHKRIIFFLLNLILHKRLETWIQVVLTAMKRQKPLSVFF